MELERVHLDAMMVNSSQDEPRALVATSVTYQEPIPLERTTSTRAGSLDTLDYK